MKINDFRNRVNEYYKRYQAVRGNLNLCQGYVKNLVDEFGNIEYPKPPYAFRVTKDMKYEVGDQASPITDINAESVLEMLHTFRDDLIIIDEP